MPKKNWGGYLKLLTGKGKEMVMYDIEQAKQHVLSKNMVMQY